MKKTLKIYNEDGDINKELEKEAIENTVQYMNEQYTCERIERI